MHGVASRKLAVPDDNLLRALSHASIDGKYLVGDSQQSVKSRLNSIAAINRDVAMQDFLKNLGVANKPLALADQLFEKLSCIGLMRVGAAHEVHRNV